VLLVCQITNRVSIQIRCQFSSLPFLALSGHFVSLGRVFDHISCPDSDGEDLVVGTLKPLDGHDCEEGFFWASFFGT
jgi:hypothetical protein